MSKKNVTIDMVMVGANLIFSFWRGSNAL